MLVHIVYFSCSTLKQGCSTGIKLILSEDGQYLEVAEVIGKHNVVNQVSASFMCVMLCLYIESIDYINKACRFL